MPTPLDFALIVLIGVVWTAYEHYLAWPRFVKRLGTGDPHARVRTYMATFAKEWFLAGLLVAAWAGQRHPWSALPLAVPSAGRLALGVALCAALVVVLGLQARA